MTAARVIYHIARADFLERVRRYSFLVTLGLAVFLGYQTAIGNLALELGRYRGAFNSAWVGAMMSLIATFFIGWFGFYLVKGSIARDRETGVGQILATTPLTRPLYLIGKGLSNFAVLMSMVLVLIVAALVIQLLRGESTQIDLIPFLSPFAFIVLPLMALVAAVAVLFESVPVLQGGFGNILYFFLFISWVPLFLENDTLRQYPAFEPTGLGILASDLGRAVTAIDPDYDGDFTLGASFVTASRVFTWDGVQWTASIILARLSMIALAGLLVLVAALFFDRFDPSRTRPARRKRGATPPEVTAAVTPRGTPEVRLTPLSAAVGRYKIVDVVLAELKLLIKGHRWWWYLGMAAINIACLVVPAAAVRAYALPVAWFWPVLVWSAMGNREIRHNVQQMTFSAASPLLRQLPAQWAAGWIVTLLFSAGAIVRLSVEGDLPGLAALAAGAVFIPSLALACGVWSGTSKLFEIVYVLMWYLGPMNRLAALDYIGANGDGRPGWFVALSIALILSAVVGRARQIRT